MGNLGRCPNAEAATRLVLTFPHAEGWPGGPNSSRATLKARALENHKPGQTLTWDRGSRKKLPLKKSFPFKGRLKEQSLLPPAILHARGPITIFSGWFPKTGRLTSAGGPPG